MHWLDALANNTNNEYFFATGLESHSLAGCLVKQQYKH